MPPIRRKRRNQNKAKKVTVSTVKILDLNDHCLLDIFQFLAPFDMCAVKDTCCRFRDLAEKQMKVCYTSEEFILCNRSTRTFNRQIKVFYKFCGLFTKLNISIEGPNRHRENDLIFAAMRKCKPKLDSLTLTDTDFETAQSRLRQFFPNLRKIKLEYYNNDFRCDIRREEIVKDIWKACKNVEEVSFGAKISAMGSCYQGIFLQQKFTNLRALELHEVRDLDLNNLKLFFKLNPKVRKLSLKRCVRIKEFRKLNLTRYAPDIEGVSVHFHLADLLENQNTELREVDELVQLERLKYLALDTCYTDIIKLITNLAQRNSLVFLSLTNVCFKINEGFAKVFSNMNNLKVLRLNMIIYDTGHKTFKDFYKILCKNLVNLEELYLLDYEVTVPEIGVIIENALSLKKLYLRSVNHLYEGELNETQYLKLVEMQCRKNAVSPLTIYFGNSMDPIPSNVFQMRSDVISLSQFDASQFDFYSLPT